MAQALGNPDPYYYAETALQGQNQQKGLGQTAGLTPQALTGAIDENFKAQQANLVTQKNIQMQNKEFALENSKFDEQKKEFSEGQTSALWGGIGKAAVSLFGSYLGSGGGAGWSALGSVFSSMENTISGWFGGGSGASDLGSSGGGGGMDSSWGGLALDTGGGDSGGGDS